MQGSIRKLILNQQKEINNLKQELENRNKKLAFITTTLNDTRYKVKQLETKILK